MKDRALATAWIWAFMLGCSSDDKVRGQLMVAISSDAAIPKDINQVLVELFDEHDVRLAAVAYPILPEDQGKPMPGTLAIVPPDAGGQRVRVRVIAERDPGMGRPPIPRIVREAVIKVPTDRVGLVPMPLRWLCDGRVEQTDAGVRSDCDEDETCAAGECVRSELASQVLEEYTPAAVFGGGDETGRGGRCMDVQACFEAASGVNPDAECSVPLPEGASADRVNVALIPESGAGHCTSEATPRCFVPLDGDPVDGFRVDAARGRVVLPRAVCLRLQHREVRSVVLSRACATKRLSTPPCGPWTPVQERLAVDGPIPAESGGGSGVGGREAGAAGDGGAGGSAGVVTGSAGTAAPKAGAGGSAGDGASGSAGDGASGSAGDGASGSAGDGASGGTNAGSAGTAGTGAGIAAGASGEAGGGGSAGVSSGDLQIEDTFVTPGGHPKGVAVGSDGNVWFTEYHGNRIGKITPEGDLEEFEIDELSPDTRPTFITAGSDGNLWFTQADGNSIGRITTQGDIEEFVLPTDASSPEHIALGSDGNVWFTERAAGRLGTITPGGARRDFPATVLGPIAADPDGDLWIAESAARRIGRWTMSRDYSPYPIPGRGLRPIDITVGPDGNFWFTSYDDPAAGIGAVTPQGEFIADFPVTIRYNAEIGAIAAGPDGNLWFASDDVGHLGRVTPEGKMTEFFVDQQTIFDITAGPDGKIWFTDFFGDRVRRFTPP